MKYWTIQKRGVLQVIRQEGVYYPDFKFSSYLQQIPTLAPLYAKLLEQYNRINELNCIGLIFTLCKREDGNISEIRDIYDFSRLVDTKRNAIDAMWKNLTKSDSVIIELEYPYIQNPLYIDINDFQYLMPPVFPIPPYTLNSKEYIIDSLSVGMFPTPALSSDIIQAHIPLLKGEFIKNVYEVADVENGKYLLAEDYELPF